MSKRTFGAILAMAAVLAWLPMQAQAQQEGRFYFEGRGGVGLSGGDIDALQDIGPAFGGQFGYWISDRVALTVGGDVNLLRGRDADFQEAFPGSDSLDADGNPVFPDEVFINTPDITTFHYVAGAELLVTAPESPFEVRWGAGGGLATLTADQLEEPLPEGFTLPTGATLPEDGEYDETTVSLYTDLKLGYDVSPRFNIFAGVRPYLSFPDSDQTAFFHGVAEQADGQGFDTAWTFPTFAGVKIGF